MTVEDEYYFMNIGDSLCEVDLCSSTRFIKRLILMKGATDKQSAIFRLKEILRDDGQTVCISVPPRALRSGSALFADVSFYYILSINRSMKVSTHLVKT